MQIVGGDLVRDPRRLAALRALGVVGSPPEEDFDRLTRLAARTLSVPLALVAFVDHDSLYVKSASGLTEPYASSRIMPLGLGLCADSFCLDTPTVIGDLRDDPRFASNEVVTKMGMVAYAGVPLTSSQGEKLGTFCVYDRRARAWTTDDLLLVQDLAAAVMTEIELRESETRYRRLVELSPEPIAVHCAGKIVYVNDAALRLVGATDRSQVEGRRMLDFVHPDYRALVLARVVQTQGERSDAGAQEEKFLRLDGHAIDVEVVAMPMMYGGAHATQVVLRDITERKRAERAMRQLTDASRALSTSLDLVLTLEAAARVAIPGLVDWSAVGVNVQGAIVWSVAHQETAQEAMLRASQTSFPPPETEVSPEAFARVLSNGAAHNVITLPLRARGTRVGTMVLARVAEAEPFDDEALLLARELAQRCGQAVENAILYRELERTIRMRDDLLAAASHDLRSPLSSIRSRAELLRRRAQRGRATDPTELVESLQRIEMSTTRMARLIDEILDAASIQMGEALRLDRRPTDAVAIVHQLADEQRQAARGHVIRVQTPEQPVVGEWDAPRLERVVANVLGNAVKYSPAGSDVEVTLERAEDHGAPWAVLHVADRGIGIPTQELSSVFEPYFRASNVSGQYVGTGLGLAISRRIVEDHGGRIEAHPRDGGGTEFTIRLPLAAHGA